MALLDIPPDRRAEEGDTVERIATGYNQGYLQALLDLQEFLPGLIDDMRLFRIRVNRKRIEEALEIYTTHREDMRLRRGFVRWNPQGKTLEWYNREGVEQVD